MPKLSTVLRKHLNRPADVGTSGKKISKKSRRHYEYAVALVSRWLAKPPTEIDALEIFERNEFKKFMLWCQGFLDPNAARHLSPATINSRRQMLRALWKTASELKWAQEPPTGMYPKNLPQVRRSDRGPWRDRDVEQMIAAANKLRPQRGGWNSTCWIALISTLHDAGTGVENVLRARIQDFVGDRLRVELRHGKTAKSIEVDLSKRSADWINAMLRSRKTIQPEAPLFDFKAKTRQLRDGLRKILKAAGLPHGRKSLFDRFRTTVHGGRRL